MAVDACNPTNQSDTNRVKCKAQWNIVEPCQYVLPVLHIQMGLVNKVLDHLKDWIDTNIEYISSPEQLLRNHFSILSVELIQLKTEHDEIERTELIKKENISIEWRQLVQLLKTPNLKNAYFVEEIEYFAARKLECKALMAIYTSAVAQSKKNCIPKTETIERHKRYAQ